MSYTDVTGAQWSQAKRYSLNRVFYILYLSPGDSSFILCDSVRIKSQRRESAGTTKRENVLRLYLNSGKLPLDGISRGLKVTCVFKSSTCLDIIASDLFQNQRVHDVRFPL